MQIFKQRADIYSVMLTGVAWWRKTEKDRTNNAHKKKPFIYCGHDWYNVSPQKMLKLKAECQYTTMMKQLSVISYLPLMSDLIWDISVLVTSAMDFYIFSYCFTSYNSNVVFCDQVWENPVHLSLMDRWLFDCCSLREHICRPAVICVKILC